MIIVVGREQVILFYINFFRIFLLLLYCFPFIALCSIHTISQPLSQHLIGVLFILCLFFALEFAYDTHTRAREEWFVVWLCNNYNDYNINIQYYSCLPSSSSHIPRALTISMFTTVCFSYCCCCCFLFFFSSFAAAATRFIYYYSYCMNYVWLNVISMMNGNMNMMWWNEQVVFWRTTTSTLLSFDNDTLCAC